MRVENFARESYKTTITSNVNEQKYQYCLSKTNLIKIIYYETDFENNLSGS